MKTAIDPKIRARRLIVRSALVLVFVGLTALSFTLGKGHSLIIDNRDLADGSLAAAADGNLVSIDGKEALEIYPGDRLMEKVLGQRHVIAVEDLMGGNRIERRVTLPLNADMLLLSVPKLIAGVEPYFEPFTPLNVAPPPEEGGSGNNSFTSPDAVVPGAEAPEAPPAPAP